jgi:hypothetical protein
MSSRFSAFCASFIRSSYTRTDPYLDAQLRRRLKTSLRPPEQVWERLVQTITSQQADAQGEPLPHLDSTRKNSVLK